MKKLYNIFDESYPQSKFDKAINTLKSFAFVIGMIFFLLVLAFIVGEYSNIEFYNKINPVAVFLQNHGVNFKVIWNDCSPYIVGWFVFAFVPLVMWSANNYKRSLREEYLVKTTSKLGYLNLEIDELKASNNKLRTEKKDQNDNILMYIRDTNLEIFELKTANKILRESNMRLFEKTPSARLRDEKGRFLPKPKK